MNQEEEIAHEEGRAQASAIAISEAKGITRGYVISWVAITASIVLAIVMGATAFYINYTENQRQQEDSFQRELERTERSEQLNQYLRVSCVNDRRGWQVLIDILEDASRTADDAVTRAYWNMKSAQLSQVSTRCFAQIPPPLPDPERD